MGKCSYCKSTEKIKKIPVPIERRGKIVGSRKVMVCPDCLGEHHPEHMTENSDGEMEPKTYEIMIRGSKAKTRGRKVT